MVTNKNDTYFSHFLFSIIIFHENDFSKQKFFISNPIQMIGGKFMGQCIGSRLQNGMVHNSKVSFFITVKTTKKLEIRGREC